MIKQLCTATIVATTLVYADPFAVRVSVPAKKPGGTSWDMAGGAPDIYVAVEGSKFTIRQACRDTYQCFAAAITRYRIGDSIYLEVYDKDLSADDLIAKGSCTIDPNRPCNLQGTVVRFVPKQIEALRPFILADASEQVAAKRLEDINRSLTRHIDDLTHRRGISEDAIYHIIRAINDYRDDFERDLSPDVKRKLYRFLQLLRKNGIDKDLIDMVNRYYRSSQSLSA